MSGIGTNQVLYKRNQ